LRVVENARIHVGQHNPASTASSRRVQTDKNTLDWLPSLNGNAWLLKNNLLFAGFGGEPVP